MAKLNQLSRREFMRVLAVAAEAYPLSSLAIKRSEAKERLNLSEPWLTLAEVQEHLFPAENTYPNISPGAKDIHALQYLQTMMKTPGFDQEESELIKNGVGWLNDLAKQQYQKMFIQLDTEKKEKLLRRIESSRAGSRWLSVLLTYLIEALLTDPVYEGNPNGIGWKWLQHQPGFPRPSKNKKYYKLGKTKYRNIKA